MSKKKTYTICSASTKKRSEITIHKSYQVLFGYFSVYISSIQVCQYLYIHIIAWQHPTQWTVTGRTEQASSFDSIIVSKASKKKQMHIVAEIEHKIKPVHRDGSKSYQSFVGSARLLQSKDEAGTIRDQEGPMFLRYWLHLCRNRKENKVPLYDAHAIRAKSNFKNNCGILTKVNSTNVHWKNSSWSMKWIRCHHRINLPKKTNFSGLW